MPEDILWLASYDLFLLDFDGLLVNTEELHFAAYREMCRVRGFSLSWDFYRFCMAAHFTSTGLQDAIYEELPALRTMEPRWDVLYEDKKQHYLALLRKGMLHLMPGVEALLLALEAQNIRRAVVTNSSREQVKIIQQALPLLRLIPTWITREDYCRPKPQPDAYLLALSTLKQAGDQVIGFEDSLRGIQALQGAGVLPVLVCSAWHPQCAMSELAGVPHFASFEDIPRLTGPYGPVL